MNSQQAPRGRIAWLLVVVCAAAAPPRISAGQDASPSSGAPCDLRVLTEENWNEYCPHGKEVDAIYGDFVLRNETIVAVIARPGPARQANMTVRNAGGALIDLTLRGRSNDQLSAFYPGAAQPQYRLGGGAAGEVVLEAKETAADASERIGTARPAVEPLTESSGPCAELRVVADAPPDGPEIELLYRLCGGQSWLEVTSTYRNPHDAPIEFDVSDAIRADHSFEMGVDPQLRLFWAHDRWWRQAYGIVTRDAEFVLDKESLERGRPLWRYARGGRPTFALAAGEAMVLERRVFPAEDLLQIKALAGDLAGMPMVETAIRVVDPVGAVDAAWVRWKQGDATYALARTDAAGNVRGRVPPGQYVVQAWAAGRPGVESAWDTQGTSAVEFLLKPPGRLTGQITDPARQPIPCKVTLHGLSGTPDPEFGPDSGERLVKNVIYSHDGRFDQVILPGSYRVLISHGPEFDADIRQISVREGESVHIESQLNRSVNTSGWISTDFHSHSSPSGDNTASQMGRVLNLLCEQIEFAPCTEHNRVSSYDAHLEALSARSHLATCPGIELTGTVFTVNHQNAFPLRHAPRTQDGGGPAVDPHPVAQIERLALWDGGSEKLVQQNHPDIIQLLGDRDLDGKADGGFRQVFSWMDVMEVHPPANILSPPAPHARQKEKRNRIFHWLQLLNLGYRIPGVVNTDAHYNHHGSGFLRNYVKSPTDDPARIEVHDVVRAAERGNVVMTSGPFLEVALEAVRLDGGDPPAGDSPTRATTGDSIAIAGGHADLTIRVECPNWLDINRVLVFLGGRPGPGLDFRRRDGAEGFGDGPVKFRRTIALDLDSDTHLIVVAAGEGLGLGPIAGPDHERDMPVAVSNPMYVDVDGNGFQASGDLLGVALPYE